MEHDGLREVLAVVKALSSEEEIIAKKELAEKYDISLGESARLTLALGQLRYIAAKINGECRTSH
jgi:hypothetical protein